MSRLPIVSVLRHFRVKCRCLARVTDDARTLGPPPAAAVPPRRRREAGTMLSSTFMADLGRECGSCYIEDTTCTGDVAKKETALLLLGLGLGLTTTWGDAYGLCAV